MFSNENHNTMLFLNLVKEHHQAYQFVMYGIHFSPFLQCGTLTSVLLPSLLFAITVKSRQQLFALHNCDTAFTHHLLRRREN